MTFLHKLAHRLARMGGLVVAALIIIACEAPVAVDPMSTSRIVLTPKSATLYTNQTADITAVGFTNAGDTALSLTMSWSVSGGTTLDTSTTGHVHHMHYRSGNQPGNFRIVARAAGTNAVDSGTITISPVPVSSVHVTPATSNLQSGQTIQLAATTYDSASNLLTGRTITWGTSNSAAAVVNGAGMVSAVGAGSAVITATSETKNGSATVAVTTVPVASVTITPSPASVAVGRTAQLTATPRDANGSPLTGRTVTWSSNNTSIATVSASGLVTGTLVGTATITATSEGQSGTTTVTVTNAPVASVTVSPSPATVTVGNTVQLTATTKDANGNVLTGRAITWTSSNTNVATVSGTGLVSGNAAGSATITGTSEGQTGTSALTVALVPVASVAVTPASAGINAGQTIQLSATTKDANGNVLTGRAITWTTNNAAVATVNASGLVTGQGAGTATITATSEGQTGTSAITVTVIPVASVTVTPASASILVAGTVQLTATLRDSSGNTLTGRVVTWTTSNAAVATVTSAGVVTGRGAGTATVTATSGGQSGSSAVTVALAPVASVTVSPSSVTIAPNQTSQLSVTLRDANGNVLTGRTVTWGTNNSGVATVNGSGLVTALAVGAAIVSASCEGQSASTAVTVTQTQQISGWPNAPASWTLINDYDMHATNDGGWSNAYPADITNGGLTVVSDASAPASPSMAWQFNYPVGYTGGVAPATEVLSHASMNALYIGFWWKPSNPWQGHSSSVNKIVEGCTNTMSCAFYKMVGSGSGPFHTQVTLEGGSGGNWNENQDTSPLTLGQWHLMEVIFDNNAHTVQWWVDRTLKGSYTGVTFPSPFQITEVYPGWGGTGDTKGEQDYYRFDQIHVMGSP